MKTAFKLKRPYLKGIVRSALKEDIGKGDITTELAIPIKRQVKAVLLAKEHFLLCGLEIASLAFELKDKRIKFRPLAQDGQEIKKGRIFARIEGAAVSILTAERVALNFLSFLSGIATKTRAYVEAVSPYRLKIMDTRKTIPGLRKLEKYAVRVGGGYNHRMGLDEMVLIKDNHIATLNQKAETSSKFQIINLRQTIEQIKKIKIKIEIEVKNLKEFKEAIKLKPDIIMLDNMSISDMKKAVRLRNALSAIGYRLSAKLEASGGITLKNVRKIAATGVEMISIGELTDSVDSADISLEVL
ncbi:MAG: carboxylating nicotinate-nucleotide diphosphorylase [Candidatus Omnitrophota bacterium]